MSQYGEIAILAVELFPDLQDAGDAWQMATEAVGAGSAPQHLIAQDAFLMLCDAGRVLGIPASVSAVQDSRILLALQLLQHQPEIPARDSIKARLTAQLEQPEQDVLLALWDVGLLEGQFAADSSQ
ncbi:DUF6979 family protein [Deinococcus roseus]|uniref:Uncharacterized protein n=1 Tax=Deinococcus roseus TaxID=392414 RepID=A0ABQ2D0U3_9DEIO|nr:hypothetical protein [Deinococcus roseus]GGJ40273.1 hypothetical protein GCM10008938_27920 [Deinococcus roseus]